MDTATMTIAQVLKEGAEHGYEPGSWLYEGDERHLEHAFIHITSTPTSDWSQLSDEDLHHAFCRLAMAIYDRKMNFIGDFGPEGKGYEKSQNT